MNKPLLIVAILVLLLGGIAITERRVGQDVDQNVSSANAKTTGGAMEMHERPVHDLAAAFIVDPNSLSDNAYQRAARAYEEVQQAQRAAAKRPVHRSDPAAPARHWRRRVEEVQRMVQASDDFPEGSIQWHMREELKQLLQEQPR